MYVALRQPMINSPWTICQAMGDPSHPHGCSARLWRETVASGGMKKGDTAVSPFRRRRRTGRGGHAADRRPPLRRGRHQGAGQDLRLLRELRAGQPDPVLLRRAQRLVGESFLDIIKDMSPEAISTVDKISGVDSTAAPPGSSG